MKYLCSVLLLVSVAEATTLSRYQSSPDGSSVQKFILNEKKATFEKRSNFFDKEKTYSLGTFSLKASSLPKEDLKKLEGILSKIKTVDEFLRKKDSSFNDLSQKDPHAPFIMLDEFRVSQTSDLYPELKRIFEKLQKLSWTQDTGIKLSTDLKTLSVIKEGKEVKREAFDVRFHCKKAQTPTVCGYKDLGILYVQ